MAQQQQGISNKPASGSDKAERPAKQGGDQAQGAGMGRRLQASKGPVTKADRNNEKSSAKS